MLIYQGLVERIIFFDIQKYSFLFTFLSPQRVRLFVVILKKRTNSHIFTKNTYICNLVAKKRTLFKNQILKKIVAAALLMVFAFSITPTIVFHNWLVNHTDTFKKDANTKSDQLGKQTFNCNCNHIVAESPFTEPEKAIIAHPAQQFSLCKAELQVQFTASPYFLYSLRGPPAV